MQGRYTKLETIYNSSRKMVNRGHGVLRTSAREENTG